MRKGLWLAGLLAALGAARPAVAQSAMNWTPVPAATTLPTTNNPALPIAQPMSYSSGFRFLDLFHFGPFLSNTTTFGGSTFPTQAQMQASSGAYLAAFGYQQPAPPKSSWWPWGH
jgi:hypothetical protein